MTLERATIIINRTPEEARLERENFMRRHGGKSAVEVMREQQVRRFELLKKQMGIFDKPAWQLMLDDLHQRAQSLFTIYDTEQFSRIPRNLIALHSKRFKQQSAESLAMLINSRTALYELARLFAPLSTKTANYLRGITQRIVESMTYSLWNVAHARAERFITFVIGRFNNEQKRLFTTP